MQPVTAETNSTNSVRVIVGHYYLEKIELIYNPVEPPKEKIMELLKQAGCRYHYSHPSYHGRVFVCDKRPEDSRLNGIVWRKLNGD